MKQYYLSNLIFFILIASFNYAQTPDLLRVEQTLNPVNNSGVQTSRFRAVLNAPIKVKAENYLILGAEFNQHDFDKIQTPTFESSSFEQLYIVDLNLGYTFKWNDKWRFIGALTPRLSSNFEQDIVPNDFALNMAAVIMTQNNEIDKPFRLVVGLSLNNASGLPFPLPILNYYKRFHSNWSYTLGIPRLDLKYHSANEKHVLQLATFLDGYYVNIQNDILLPESQFGSGVSLSALVLVTGYQFKFTKEISVYGILGYSLFQKSLIRDDSRNQLFTLNDTGNIYLRTGFKIGIF